MKNVLLIAGGWSSEREISLRGAMQIEKALISKNYNVTFFDPLYDFDKLHEIAKQHDVAFVNLHGSPGEDGLIQAILDTANCPYQGGKPAPSFLALHKAAAKQIFRANGILTADWIYLPKSVDISELDLKAMQYPLFIKSNTGGSSLNLFRAENREELQNALNEIFSKKEEVIIEPALNGVEITCGVLDGYVLPPIMIKPKAKFFDHHDKYAEDGAKEICPAPISEELTKKVQKLAKKAHDALGLTGYSRSDFILTENNEFYILETNTIPGMTATSLVPQEAAYVGLDFADLIEYLLKLAMK